MSSKTQMANKAVDANAKLRDLEKKLFTLHSSPATSYQVLEKIKDDYLETAEAFAHAAVDLQKVDPDLARSMARMIMTGSVGSAAAPLIKDNDERTQRFEAVMEKAARLLAREDQVGTTEDMVKYRAMNEDEGLVDDVKEHAAEILPRVERAHQEAKSGEAQDEDEEKAFL